MDISYDEQIINDDALSFLSEYENTFPNLTVVHNDLGNLNTGLNNKLSDSLFKVTINCHKTYTIKNDPKIGIAYNGLGLNQLYRKNYKKADSLFLKAINQLDNFYGENQNSNQLISYLNIAESKIDQFKFIEGLSYLKKANLVKTNCFKGEQTIYDAYVLKLEGDLNEEKALSIDKYTQALTIAKNYFNEDHSFIKALEYKIQQ